MFGRKRKKIAQLKESKHRLNDAIVRYRAAEVELRSKLHKAETLNEYYRVRNAELRTKLFNKAYEEQ